MVSLNHGHAPCSFLNRVGGAQTVVVGIHDSLLVHHVNLAAELVFSADGELITRYVEASAAKEAVDLLLTLENEPVRVNAWIEEYMNPALLNRMKQTIRARRKRHFNAEHQHTRKKSIDLEFMVWQRLAGLAQRRGKTLSETIVQLIEDAEHKEKYANKMSTLKQDLQALLGKD